MGLLDQVLGGVLGGQSRGGMGGMGGMGGGGSPIMMALMALLSQGGGSGGLGGLLGGGQGGGGLGGGGLGGMSGNQGMGGSGMGGGLGGLLDSFNRSGHGDIANSWVGTGQNRPIAPHQLEEALGSGTIDQLTHQTGLSRGDLLSQLSAHLPDAVDRLTPHGRMPDQDEMRHW